MTIHYKILSQADYVAKRYDTIKTLETNASTDFLRLHDDGKGLATIGVGFNVEGSPFVRDKVIEVIASGAPETFQRELAKTIENGASASVASVAAELDAQMKAYSDANPSLNLRKTFSFLNEGEVRLALNNIAEPYEETVTTKLSNVPIYSEERLALFSLAYNETPGPQAYIGPKLIAAIANGDRAEAWYEIRYNSNGGEFASGVAKRHYYESEVFSPYEDHDTPTKQEAEDFAKMYARHKAKILSYDENYDVQLTRDYNAGFAHDFQYHMQPAIEKLREVYDLPADAPIEEVLMVSEEVRHLEGGGTPYDSAENDDDLLIGDDASNILKGGDGSNYLIGEAGDDILKGGGAESSLHGGTGKDIFSLSNMSFIMDGESNDRTVWGGYLISGGVQQWWQEGGYAYYSAAAPLVNIGIGSQILLGALTLFDAPFMTSTRFAMTTSNQLLIQKGRHHTAFVQEYDYEDATAGITVFRQALTTDGTIADLTRYMKLALKASGMISPDADPLIIDMNGDGITLSRVGSATSVYIDANNDGFAENRGWVRGGDALLVRDTNGNGRVDGWGELFGNASESGFAALRAFDSNADDRITAADAHFSRLHVWVDDNHNAISEAGELRTLSHAGITALSLATRAPADAEIRGNRLTAEADVTFADGRTTAMADVILTHNAADTQFTGNATVTAAAAALPQLKGFGAIADLRVVMSGSSTLRGLVSTAAAATTWDAAIAATEAVLYRWAGVQGVSGTDLDPSTLVVTARQLAFLEKYYGTLMTPRDANGVVQMNNGKELFEAWQDALQDATVRMLVQGGMKTLVQGKIAYDSADNSLSVVGVDGLATLYQSIWSGLSTGSAGLNTWQSVWAPILQQLHEGLTRADGIAVKNDFVAQSLMQAVTDSGTAFALTDVVAGLGLPSVQVAGAGVSALTRQASGQLDSPPAVYMVTGGQDITLTGGVGQDVFLLGQNFGNVTIIDEDAGQQGDRIRFTEHVESEIRFQRDGDDLLLTNRSTGKVVRGGESVFGTSCDTRRVTSQH
jgi:hypothetical protein